MNMTTLQIISDVVVGLIIALMVFLGVKRGFVKSFFKSTKIFFVILVTILIGSLIASLCQNLFVNSWFEGTVSEKLVEKAESIEGEIDFAWVKESVPSAFANLVPMDELEKEFSSLSGNKTEIAREIGKKIEGAAIDVVSNVIGYVLAFVLSFIICTVAILIIQKVWEMPVLNWLNHLAGVLWGIATAYLWASVAVCIIALIFGNEFIEGTFVTNVLYKIGLFTF
jgi:uncharacterized membrane protein required for colicin V production